MTQYIEFTLSGKIPLDDDLIAYVVAEGEDPEDVEALLEAFQGYGSILDFVESEDYDLR